MKLFSMPFLVMMFFSCSLLAKPGALRREADDNLTSAFAEMRKSQVKTVDYKIHVDLQRKAEGYTGRTTLILEMARTDIPLSIDFLDNKISAVKVNGKTITDYVERKGSFDIPAKYLAKNTEIEVEYSGPYNKKGIGFLHSVDPEDGAEYFATDFEPYDAHTFFPCLDQPDLRATYKVSVAAPKEWRIVANELVESTKDLGGERQETHFLRTKPFSTYLMFVGAGPFVEWKDTAKDGTPIYLWARKSLAKYVDHENIMNTTKKGLEFFSDYFGYPYPFSKYGQIFIPEFGSGGMENPGAITLNERNIYRGPVTQAARDGRDSLILHEMAHMWFGDLVTMVWWNDLWLNESFATYLAALAQDRAMNSKSVWLNNFGSKTWGLWQDQLVTTHPIETPVPDIRTAMGNFDGITYAKGGASLKQLHYFVGEDAFREGVRNYFKKFAWKNTVRADFVGEIAAAAKKDLRPWTKAWLQTSGPNRVEARWSCAAGKLASFEIIQKPSSSGTLSPHKTKVGLFALDESGKLRITSNHDVSYSKAVTALPELRGAPCPDFVYPNLDDQDYALFALDPASLKLASQALTGGMEDPLLRVMLWNGLAQMVRDGALPVKDFFLIGLAGLAKEKNEEVLAQLLHRNGSLREYYFSYLTKSQRLDIAHTLETIVYTRLREQPAGSNLQLMFFDFYTSMAQTPDTLARVRGFLDEKDVPSGIKVDQDRRWNLIMRLAVEKHPEAEALIAAEEKKDSTTTGQKMAYAAKVAIPVMANKDKRWTELQDPEKMPYSMIRQGAGYFHSPNHPELSAHYVGKLFDKIQSLDWKKHDNLVRIYFGGLFPSNLCSKGLLEESRTELKSAKTLTSLARRAWLEANDELAKCVKVRAQ